MLTFSEPVTSATKVDSSLHNVSRVNSIKKKYPGWRQESKVPTFRSDIRRDLHHSDEEPWFV